MVWWIVGGVVLFALIVLVTVAVGTVGRARGLQRAAGTAQARDIQVAALQRRVTEMQESLASLATRAETTQERLQTIQTTRVAQPDSGQTVAKQTIAAALRRRRR